MKQFPYISEELITALNERIPHISPNKGESIETLMWRGGMRSVVDLLTQIHEDQLQDNFEE